MVFVFLLVAKSSCVVATASPALLADANTLHESWAYIVAVLCALCSALRCETDFFPAKLQDKSCFCNLWCRNRTKSPAGHAGHRSPCWHEKFVSMPGNIAKYWMPVKDRSEKIEVKGHAPAGAADVGPEQHSEIPLGYRRWNRQSCGNRSVLHPT